MRLLTIGSETLTYFASNFFGPNEGDMLDEGRCRQMFRVFGQTADDLVLYCQVMSASLRKQVHLNKVRIVAAGTQAVLDHLDVPHRRPNDLLRTFQDDSVTSKYTGHNGRPSVVQG